MSTCVFLCFPSKVKFYCRCVDSNNVELVSNSSHIQGFQHPFRTTMAAITCVIDDVYELRKEGKDVDVLLLLSFARDHQKLIDVKAGHDAKIRTYSCLVRKKSSPVLPFRIYGLKRIKELKTLFNNFEYNII